MALVITEFFGYPIQNESARALEARQMQMCPFLQGTCTKRLRGGVVSGVCSVRLTSREAPIICCPKRLYAEDYRILRDVSAGVFGPQVPFILGPDRLEAHGNRKVVVALGANAGGEVKLPQVEGRGGFFVDWILALLSEEHELEEFVAVEVQSIDITGNYHQSREALLRGGPVQPSKGGVNWENVNKRILPQLIFKGHVLRRERLCKKGLFFICPGPVYDKIHERLGGSLIPYPASTSGTLTFRWYDSVSAGSEDYPDPLRMGGEFITTVEQVAYAFMSPGNMPPPDSYTEAIRHKLR